MRMTLKSQNLKTKYFHSWKPTSRFDENYSLGATETKKD